jgi:protein gp37
MADKTGIEWTDATWNPITGCSKVSQGCKHCYAERDWARLSANPGTKYFGRDFTDVATHADALPLPCRWTKPRRIFVNSMSDLFHESVPFEFIAAVFGVMAGASWHSFQVLTKRPQRMLDFFAWLDAHPERAEFDSVSLHQKYPGADWRPFLCADLASRVLPDQGEGLRIAIDGAWPLPNVWLGVSVEDQAAADERVPLLLKAPAAVRFLSVEPMLGEIELTGHEYSVAPGLDEGIDWLTGKTSQASNIFGGDAAPWRSRDCYDFPQDAEEPRIHWVISGGESGPHARPMHPDWARSLRDQCAAARVAFLHKQNGEWVEKQQADMIGDFSDVLRGSDGGKVITRHGAIFYRVGKKAAGRLLDGVEHNGYPEVRHG